MEFKGLDPLNLVGTEIRPARIDLKTKGESVEFGEKDIRPKCET